MEKLGWPEGVDFAYYYIIDGRNTPNNDPSIVYHLPEYHYGIKHLGVNPE